MTNIATENPSSHEISRLPLVIGILTVLTALLLNKWTLERLIVADEYIESVTSGAIIVVFQLVLLTAGVWIFRNRRRISLPDVAAKVVAAALLAAVAVGIYGALKATYIIDPNREFRLGWQRIMKNEELILVLNIRLKNLSGDAMNLQIPGQKSRSLFADTVSVRSLEPLDGHAEDATQLPEGITERHLHPQGDLAPVSTEQFSPWPNLLERVSYFEHAKFKFVTGMLAPESEDKFDTLILFSALARLKSGGFMYVKAYQDVTWDRVGNPDPEGSEADAWKITGWDTRDVKLQFGERLLFSEVLSRSLSREDARKATRSIHEELIADFLGNKETFKPPHDLFHPASWDRHPAVSVVDLNRDGFDDIYVMARWGKNQFFRNRGDGTFVEEAATWGLDIDSHTNAALFADFDNDGDYDVILGRSLERSMYLVNDGGRFTDRTQEQIDIPLPYAASSISAADYDNDGLLDLYISTYAGQQIAKTDREFWGRYMSREDGDTVEKMINSKDAQRYMNRPGPPNVLLHNAGNGRFELAQSAPNLRVFANTYQSTWADFDDDGDADLYVANDFAPNNLFRNDGGGAFTDISVETGTTDIGFGMGASWGDYDGDLRQDLYVSNMFSKAGRRILSQLPTADERLSKMANGNTLFRNEGEKFAKVSGLTPPGILVEEIGWSWGSQFADFNNDGALDLYALSGFYTAPGEHELPVDI